MMNAPIPSVAEAAPRLLSQAELLSYAQRGARERLSDLAVLRTSGLGWDEADPRFAEALADAEAIAVASQLAGVEIQPAFARALVRARRAAVAEVQP